MIIYVTCHCNIVIVSVVIAVDYYICYAYYYLDNQTGAEHTSKML